MTRNKSTKSTTTRAPITPRILNDVRELVTGGESGAYGEQFFREVLRAHKVELQVLMAAMLFRRDETYLSAAEIGDHLFQMIRRLDLAVALMDDPILAEHEGARAERASARAAAKTSPPSGVRLSPSAEREQQPTTIASAAE